MLYKNSNGRAIMAMEESRLGESQEDEVVEKCPICDIPYPEYLLFDIEDNCVGCDCCVYKKKVGS